MVEPTSATLYLVCLLPVVCIFTYLKHRDDRASLKFYNVLYLGLAALVAVNSIYFVIHSGSILSFEDRLVALLHVLPALASYLFIKSIKLEELVPAEGDESEREDERESGTHTMSHAHVPFPKPGQSECTGLFLDNSSIECEPETFVIDTRIERDLEEFISLISLAGKKAADKKLDLPRGMLIHGPPGTGKTTLGRLIPKLARARCVTLCIDVLKNEIGKAHDSIDRLLQELDEQGASVVLLDELDLCAKSRAEKGQSERDDTLSFLLHMLERVHSTRRVFVIATTSRPELIDDAVLRPGRFDRVMKTLLPTPKQRVQILLNYLKRCGASFTIDPEGYEQVTDAMSGAELKSVVANAHTLAMLETPDEDDADVVVSDQHISESIIRVVGERKKAA